VAAVLKFNYDAIASGSLTTLQDLTVYSTAVITHASGTSAIVGRVNLAHRATCMIMLIKIPTRVWANIV
jgi:hypothetical protein